MLSILVRSSVYLWLRELDKNISYVLCLNCRPKEVRENNCRSRCLEVESSSTFNEALGFLSLQHQMTYLRSGPICWLYCAMSGATCLLPLKTSHGKLHEVAQCNSAIKWSLHAAECLSVYSLNLSNCSKRTRTAECVLSRHSIIAFQMSN